jgi:hypothetical protein
MKKKHIIFIVLSFFATLIISCSSLTEELVAPNPGFGIFSTGMTRFGTDVPIPWARTKGTLGSMFITNEILIPAGATGTEKVFDVTSNIKAKAIVPNAVAPGFWRLEAVSGWSFISDSLITGQNFPSCDGMTAFGPMQRGQFNKITCIEGRGFGGLLPGLPSINVSAPAVEFQMGGASVNATYGMPTFQFYNMYGTFVAQTTATSIDTGIGEWAKGWTNCLAGLPAGTYSIDLINATADGTGERLSTAVVYLYGAESANPIDDNDYFVSQQYRDLLNRESDAEGFSTWSGLLSQCTDVAYREPNETYAQCVVRKRIYVSRGFWYSNEFLALHPGLQNPPGSASDFNNSEFIRLCYVLYLRRDPTQADMDFWVAPLSETNDYDSVIKWMITSNEYRRRFQPPTFGCNPTSTALARCGQLNGWWDYDTCKCNYGELY